MEVLPESNIVYVAPLDHVTLFLNERGRVYVLGTIRKQYRNFEPIKVPGRLKFDHLAHGFTFCVGVDEHGSIWKKLDITE